MISEIEGGGYFLTSSPFLTHQMFSTSNHWERENDWPSCFPFLISEILSIRQLLAGLAPPKAPADTLASASVPPAYVSVRRPFGGMEVLPLWVRDVIELQAGPALVLGFQGENVYIFFQLPRIEVKWSSLFLFHCIT